MVAGIRGTFPGGPSREADALSRTRALRLERIEEIEARAARWSLARTRRRRRARATLGMVVVVTVSGGAGLAVGLRSHVTAEEMNARAAEAARAATHDEDVNRALLELWRMEDVEYERNVRGR